MARNDTATDADGVDQARTRARRRLIGAVLLLGIGIIGFPLLFETQPRPIAVDIPIRIPPKDGQPPLTVPPPRLPSAASLPTPAVAAGRVIEETAAEAGRDVAPVAASAPPVAAGASRPAPAATEAERAADEARAKALLEGRATAQAAPPPRPAAPPPKPAAVPPKPVSPSKPPAASAVAPANGRFVVQVGAFADASAARDMRAKVERLGLRTYTQVVDTDAGKRIRVRVGPFGSRDDAARAADKIKSAGLPTALLTL